MPASQVQPKDHISATDSQGQLYIHDIETELLGSLPRPVRRAPTTIAVRWSFWVLLLGFFGLTAYLGQRDLDSWDALLQYGKTVQATVTGKNTTTNDEGTQYILTYTFRTSDGFDRSGSMLVDRVTYDRTKAGDQATKVTYLPSSHGKVWQIGIITASKKARRKRIWIIMILNTAAMWCLLIGVCEWRWKRQLWLIRNGVAVTAQVTQGKVTHGHKGQTYYDLTYQFPIGSEMIRRTVRVRKRIYQKYTAGNPFLTVLYDPKKPGGAQPYCLLRSGRVTNPM